MTQSAPTGQLVATCNILVGNPVEVKLPKRNRGKVRLYNAIPTNATVSFDQQAEVVTVIHLLQSHGSSLEAHVTVDGKDIGSGGSSAGGIHIDCELWQVEF